MTTGGYFPSPERYGASQGSLLENIVKSINAARGTAYASDTSNSIVHIENVALARAIWGAWQDAQRLANQFDPLRMTDFLSRWETILEIIPLPGQTELDRRLVVAAKFKIFGDLANASGTQDIINTLLGNIFVSILYNSSQDVDGYGYGKGAFPGGLDLTSVGGIKLISGDWVSPVSLIMIRIHQPANMDLTTFYTKAKSIFAILLDFLPAWCQFDYYNPGPLAIANNADGTGFFLDEVNLDNELFDS